MTNTVKTIIDNFEAKPLDGVRIKEKVYKGKVSIISNELHLDNAGLQVWASTQKDGDYRITVKSTRTLKQNSTFHMWCKELSELYAEHKRPISTAMAKKRLKENTNLAFEEKFIDKDGNFQTDWIYKSSSDMTIAEFNTWVEVARNWWVGAFGSESKTYLEMERRGWNK